MSHVATVNLEIKDLDAIEAACAMLGGMTLVRGQKTFNWYGKWVRDYASSDAAYRNGIKAEDYGKCEHAIKVDGCDYEIGLARNPNSNGWVVVYDFWGPGATIKQKIGAEGQRLKQAYAASVAKQAALKKGLRVEQFTNPKTGEIKLTITGSTL